MSIQELENAINGKSVDDMNTCLRNKPDLMKMAPILCCKADSSDCLEDLINKKVNISETDENGNDLLICAALHDSRQCLQLLLNNSLTVSVSTKTSNKDQWTALLYAAYNGNAEGVSKLIKFGADVNACDCSKYSPLLRAAEAKSIECMSILLSPIYKVNVNHQNVKGWTALHFATNNKSTSCTKLLLDSKLSIDINKADNDGETALMKGSAYVLLT